MGLRCKRCGGEEHVKNGFMKGLQRYCKLDRYLVPKSRRWMSLTGGAEPSSAHATSALQPGPEV